MNKTDKAIAMVSKIRARNNRNWMQLLALAVKCKPRLAKRILRQIGENDREVTKWLNRI